jgi:hypothetical protein
MELYSELRIDLRQATWETPLLERVEIARSILLKSE